MGPSKGNPQKQNLAAAKKARAKQQAKPPAKKGKGGRGPSAAVQALLNDPAAFTAPQTYGQAIAEGGRVADLTYGPQIAQVQLQQRQAPAWFDQYRAALQTPAQTAAQYAPAIQAVNANAAETAQATPGIDPNSEAGKTDALAAKAREALVHLGASTLTANQQADTTYYQGRQGVADAAQIGANTQLSSQLGSLQGQRGAAVAQYVGQARQQERDYGIAQQHQQAENAAFGVKAYTAQQTAKDKRARLRQQRRDSRARQQDKNQDQSLAGKKFRSQQEKDAYQKAHGLGPYKKPAASGGQTPASIRAEKNRIEQVRLRSGKALGRLGTAQDIWESLKKSKITTGQKDDKGNDITRPTTPSDIKAELLKRGYSADEIHLMLMIRAGKKFGPAEIAAAHRLGIRIPRKYLPSNKPATYGTQAAPDGSGGSRPT